MLVDAIGILAFVTVATSLPASNPEVVDRSSLVQCFRDPNVPYAISTSPNWAQYIKPFNLRLPYTPAAVTLPTTSRQVGDGITCAAANGLKVQPKGGGHSYASYSSGGRDGSVIIDMEAFNKIEVDQSKS